MIGTRGVPPRYGGFETAVAEIGTRLVRQGHDVMVYCRRTGDAAPPEEFNGMRLVTLPAARERHLETLSHTAASVIHQVVKERSDVAMMFNAANSLFLPALKAVGIPVAVNVDGLEWKRSKWGPVGRRYYQAAEKLAARWADAVISDAREIQRHYRDCHGVDSVFIPYGANVLELGDDRLAELGLRSRQYHLVVARLEPENNVEMIVAGYRASGVERPLVVVGGCPYENDVQRRLRGEMDADPKVRAVGSVWDQELLDQLYANALTYVHGHSAGGTNPSLLRAMGAGASVLAYDSVFNREVLGDEAEFFPNAVSLAASLIEAEKSTELDLALTAKKMKQRIVDHYDWDDVADRYADLAYRLTGQPQPQPRELDRVA